jgi:hypothetical protein
MVLNNDVVCDRLAQSIGDSLALIPEWFQHDRCRPPDSSTRSVSAGDA